MQTLENYAVFLNFRKHKKLEEQALGISDIVQN